MQKETKQALLQQVASALLQEKMDLFEANGWLNQFSYAVLGKMQDIPQGETWVFKKDGRLEKYNDRKIAFVLERVSDEVNEPMTRGDIDYILHVMAKNLTATEALLVPSVDIRVMLKNVLQEQGFDTVCHAYSKKKK